MTTATTHASGRGHRTRTGEPARRVELLRAAWGTALLLAPVTVYRAVEDRAPDERARRVLRVLGARHLVQAGLSGLLPSRLALAGGAAVDGIHALTALTFGTLDASRRRTVLLDAGIASLWAAASVRDLRRLGRR